MWYEVNLPKEIGFATSPHDLNEKAWRMKNAVWKDGAIEDIDIPLAQMFVGSNPVNVDLAKQAYDVCRIYGWKRGAGESMTCVTAFATGQKAIGIDENGNEVFAVIGNYRLLPYNLTKYAGLFVMGDVSGTDYRFYYANGSLRQLGKIMEKPSAPSVKSAILHSDDAIEYRYKVVYVDEDFGFYSCPSDAVGCLGLYNPSPSVNVRGVAHDCRMMLLPDVSGATPQDIDKVRIYRWNEVVGVYVFLKEVTTSSWWAKEPVYDDAPADYVSNDILPENVIPLPSGRITAIGTLGSRVIYAIENAIYISEPAKPFWIAGDIPPLLVDGVVENIFRWGSHLLVQTRFSWYRLFETENGFVIQPLSLPTATDRASVRKTKAGLGIVSYRGVYLFTPDEQLLQLPIRIDIMEGSVVDAKPVYFRIFRDNMDVVLPDGSYYRIDAEGHVTGLHDRLKVFAWGE